jgi:type III secretion protein R
MQGSPLPALLFVSALALVPFLLLSVTSFIKLSVVFGILRNALGAQQIPSAAVTSLLCLVLTLQIMNPVAHDVYERALPFFRQNISDKDAVIEKTLVPLVQSASEPVLLFLLRNSRLEERLFFLHPSSSSQAVTVPTAACPAGQTLCLLPGEGFFSLVPSFVLTELRSAFALGFLLFLPFVVIDIVVANLLVGVGMTMVSPMTLSLPLKILVFVGCDAWFLLCRSLVLGYAHG